MVCEVRPMNARTDSKAIYRVETGSRCEEVGCYRLADWNVAFGGSNYSWCSKHTTGHMKDDEFWLMNVGAKV
jgi:hypothetical protein